MKVAVFSARPYEREFLDPAAHSAGQKLSYFDVRLTNSSLPLAQGHGCVCVFVNDVLNAENLTRLAELGVRLVALRCAGFNNVDLEAADRLGIVVVRVPAYSPYAVAEHTVGMILALNRKLHRAYQRVREGNFALNGLLGFDLNGHTVGVVGTGKIGAITARILHGFGCRIRLFDLYPNPELASIGEYVSLDELFATSDIITLHCPLSPQTHHLINHTAIERMKRGVMLINTSRGAIIDTSAVIKGLKSGHVGYLGIDVYEEEADLFFEDLSDFVIQDDIFARLLTFPNVLITGHQAFFTREALTAISETTMHNVRAIERGEACANRVAAKRAIATPEKPEART